MGTKTAPCPDCGAGSQEPPVSDTYEAFPHARPTPRELTGRERIDLAKAELRAAEREYEKEEQLDEDWRRANRRPKLTLIDGGRVA